MTLEEGGHGPRNFALGLMSAHLKYLTKETKCAENYI